MGVGGGAHSGSDAAGSIEHEMLADPEQPPLKRTPGWRAPILAGLLLLFACGESGEPLSPGTGSPLPAVVLAGLTHEAPVSTDALRGRALVINFWASWCAPCRSEMPGLERLSHRLAVHGVQVIGVTVDQDLNLAREFVRAQRLTFPNYADSGARLFQAALRVGRLPETVLVTADGAIAARVAGARDWDGAEGSRLLEHALGLPPGTVPDRPGSEGRGNRG